MKQRIIYSLSVVLLSAAMFAASCKSDGSGVSNIHNPGTGDTSEAQGKDLPVMTFEQDMFDFGDIKQDDVVTHNFKFTNTGKSDLIITNARASCGCTVPEYPKEPVKPGESGIIKVTFNSHNKKDAINKTVTVTANTYPSENKLQIKGIVVVPAQ